MRDNIDAMSLTLAGQTPCPKCEQPNPAAAEYCWACHYDLKPDAPAAPAASAAPPPVAPAAVAPPSSLRFASARQRRSAALDAALAERVAAPADEAAAPSLARAMILTVLAVGIVGGSWWVAAQRRAGAPPVGTFVAIWFVVLGLTWLGKRFLPAPSRYTGDYFSLNPFQRSDDMHRALLSAHLLIFIPGLVLGAMQAWRALIMPSRSA